MSAAAAAPPPDPRPATLAVRSPGYARAPVRNPSIWNPPVINMHQKNDASTSALELVQPVMPNGIASRANNTNIATGRFFSPPYRPKIQPHNTYPTPHPRPD